MKLKQVNASEIALEMETVSFMYTIRNNHHYVYYLQ